MSQAFRRSLPLLTGRRLLNSQPLPINLFHLIDQAFLSCLTFLKRPKMPVIQPVRITISLHIKQTHLNKRRLLAEVYLRHSNRLFNGNLLPMSSQILTQLHLPNSVLLFNNVLLPSKLLLHGRFRTLPITIHNNSISHHSSLLARIHLLFLYGLLFSPLLLQNPGNLDSLTHQTTISNCAHHLLQQAPALLV